MSIKNGGPAFPHAIVYPDNAHEAHSGLSTRDYFAAKAMQSHISGNINLRMEDVAKWSYQYADAMLAEREKTND